MSNVFIYSLSLLPTSSESNLLLREESIYFLLKWLAQLVHINLYTPTQEVLWLYKDSNKNDALWCLEFTWFCHISSMVFIFGNPLIISWEEMFQRLKTKVAIPLMLSPCYIFPCLKTIVLHIEPFCNKLLQTYSSNCPRLEMLAFNYEVYRTLESDLLFSFWGCNSIFPLTLIEILEPSPNFTVSS